MNANKGLPGEFCTDVEVVPVPPDIFCIFSGATDVETVVNLFDNFRSFWTELEQTTLTYIT